MTKSTTDLFDELAKLTAEQRTEIVQRIDEFGVAEGRYKYRAEGCDVICKQKLRQFRVQKIKWLFWLRGDDQHAIRDQVTALLSDYAMFQTINDLRVKQAKSKRQGVHFNASVLFLLDSGFVAKQAMGIRRLIDKSGDVISLKRLVDDIKQNRELISREVFVAHDGLPYDYACVREAYYAEKIKVGKECYFEGVETSGPKAFGASERCHKVFDSLAGIAPSHRKRDDMLPAQLFDDLSGKLGVCADLQKFADKFIAHPADPNSRSKLTASQNAVTLKKLTQCLQAIVAVASSISRRLLGDGTSWTVPQPSFDPIKNLDKAWIETNALEEARQSLEKHMTAIEKWSA